MDPKELSQRVLRQLGEERAAHGYGSASGIDLKIGKSEGYLGRVLRGEVGLHVDMLFEALDALDADPADFFARVVGARVRPVRLLRRVELQIKGEVPAVLERLGRLMAGEKLEKPRSEAPDGDELRDRLDLLDELRFSEPDEVVEPAEEILADALRLAELGPGKESMKLLCRALGVLASGYRAHARFGLAARCLRFALALSAKWKLRKKVRAELLQRVCYLLGDQGDYQVAVEIARQACETYVMLSDRSGIGRALVDRAIMLSRAGDPEGAVEAYLGSLGYLPEAPWYSRCSVYHGLGCIHTRLGDLEQAEEWVSRASAAHQTRDGQNWWRVIWLQGEIALKRGDLESAERSLREARDAFLERTNPLDVAVISLRLAKALFVAGRLREMQGIAAEMLRLLKPLGKHKIASAAIQEFTRAALAGEATVELLDRTCRQIMQEKGCPPAVEGI